MWGVRAALARHRRTTEEPRLLPPRIASTTVRISRLKGRQGRPLGPPPMELLHRARG